jgi:predicted Zn-dependent protease
MKNMLRSKFLGVLTLLVILFASYGCANDPQSSNGGGDGFEYDHQQNPGLSANDLLSDESFSELVVEIDYMPGYAPNARALDSLQAFLEQRLNKTSVTILEPTQISSADQNSYSASDVRSLENQHRNNFSEEGVLATYLIIVDGYYSEQNVLGIAYYNTSNAFFGPAYEDASTGFGSLTRYQVEAISFRHEFGHLFGLVNVPNSGTDMQTEHQDEQNGSHCDNENCLMYYAMQRSDLIEQLFNDESIPALDANCRADLQANGGK